MKTKKEFWGVIKVMLIITFFMALVASCMLQLGPALDADWEYQEKMYRLK